MKRAQLIHMVLRLAIWAKPRFSLLVIIFVLSAVLALCASAPIHWLGVGAAVLAAMLALTPVGVWLALARRR